MNWYSTSIKAIMGQLGKQLYKELDPGNYYFYNNITETTLYYIIYVAEDKAHLLICLNQIDERKDIIESAKCLIKVRKKHVHKSHLNLPNVYKEDKLPTFSYNNDKDRWKEDFSEEWVGGFRTNKVSRIKKLKDVLHGKEKVK